jgi:predicted AlkP superfamily pyrophosphatase or phosphodiesterase
MKKYIAIAALLCATYAAPAQGKKAVFIIIDGVSKDVLDKVNTPNIRAIAAEGGLISANQGGEKGGYTQTPTISAPGYNNILTGVWFNKHNVPDNDIKAANHNYPTIFRLLESMHPSKKTAIFSSWLDNRTKLVGEGLSSTGMLQLDYHFDGLELDTLKYPHDKEAKYMAKIDQAVAEDAARVIAADAPDLSWVYMEYTDDMGHRYGNSKQYNDAIEAADQRIGKIWDAVKLRRDKFNEDWLIVVTTDHGRDPETGRNHGGQSDRERGSWIVTNSKQLNSYARKTKQVAVVDILPTIARHLELNLSQDQLRELDGIPLIGELSLSGAQAKRNGKQIALTWLPQEKDGTVKIWMSTSNAFKETGKPDEYILMGKAKVAAGKFNIDLKDGNYSKIYKIVLEGENNTVNRWILN